MEGLALWVKMVKPLMNCNVSNSSGDPSLLYKTSWSQWNLCLMEELVLHALPDFMCHLPFDSLRGVGMLSCSSSVYVSSFLLEDSDS